MDVVTALGLLALAGAVGTYGTIIGAGGGFLLIPGLVLLFDLAGVAAVGTGAVALAAIGITGAISYDRKGLVARDVAGYFSLASVPLALFCSAVLAARVDSDVFIAILGFVLLALAVFVVVVPSVSVPVGPERPVRRGPLMATGAGVGTISGLFAVGGGLVTVPALGRIQNFAPHRAAATTSATTSAASLAASLGHGIAGNVEWDMAAVLLVGAVAGSALGARMAGRLAPRLVMILLAGGLVLAAVPLIVTTL